MVTVTVLSLLLLFATALVAYPVVKRFGNGAFNAIAAVPLLAFFGYAALLPETLNNGPVHWEYEWIPQFNINLTFEVDLFSNCLALLVTGAGALILSYCSRYFERGDKNCPRFAAVFVAFAGSMLGLVVSDNVYLLFSFWEATTVLSFLLIGHSGKRLTNRAAAMQAIIVTTLGGLAMLVGLIMLNLITGSANLSEIIAAAPQDQAAVIAVFLVLAGAISKSAIFPFHFWLPAAMAAPTPVSAYLHAAAMVKAGIYLIAKLTPAFGEMPGYRETLVILGGITMLLGALRALAQYDLKLILAFGTVSQLGMLVMLYGVADPRVSSAATALVFAHALAKAPLFLSVGMIEHRTGTRDLRHISGLAKQAPALAIVTSLAAFSMIGGPPLIGFVAKEAALTELFSMDRDPIATVALVVLIVGSCCTAAYMMRFVWGAFSNKLKIMDCRVTHEQHGDMLLAPGIFVLAALAGGVFASALDNVYQKIRPSNLHPEHFALWHGITPALITTCLTLVIGVLLLVCAGTIKSRLLDIDDRWSATAIYFKVMRALVRFAVAVTSLTQRGSLPFYLSVILVVALFAVGGSVIFSDHSYADTVLFNSAAEIVLAVLISAAAIATLVAKKRFQAVILVGLTGIGMVALFGLNGAPDLALTQGLVEIITLIAFVLVIRRLPQRLNRSKQPLVKIRNAVIGTSMGLLFGVLALVALGSREHSSISEEMAQMAVDGGHGYNVVNVILVDIRGWDTFGELSVILAAATGVASLIFLSNRADNLPKLGRKEARGKVQNYLSRVADPNDPAERGTWMLAGRDLSPQRRSIVLEVVVRVLFHALIILSIYLLFTGHNAPGGGFAGGLVAGLALVARYLAGGRSELGATVPFDAGRIVGTGMAISAITAIVPLFFGQSALTSSWIDADLGPWGILPLVSSTAFDIGVYLVVFGLVLDVLRSLGAQIDVQTEQDLEVSSR